MVTIFSRILKNGKYYILLVMNVPQESLYLQEVLEFLLSRPLCLEE